MNGANIHIEGDNSEIVIGENTTFYGKISIAALENTKINIEKDCLFSSDIIIRTGDSHKIYDEHRKRINENKDINIKEHVWCGSNVIILKGSLISKNSIIGAGSVVTKKFQQENICIAGNPAKMIKENVNWSYN